jgi:cobalt-zinc-cadmium efflux system outer membrane protein
MRRTRDLLPVVVLLAAGCRSLADYQPATPPPGPEVLAHAPAPVPAPTTAPAGESGHAITLEEAIEEALARAPDLRAASEVIVQARADLRTASLLPNPQVTSSTTLQHLGGQFTPENPGGPPQYAFDLAQPFDSILFGKRAAAIASARRAVDVAGADLADVRRRRAADVAAAFLDVLEARAVVDLARVDLDDLRTIQDLTRRRLQLGGSAPVDLDRATLAVASAAQDLRSAETAHASALAILGALIGRSAPAPVLELSGRLDVLNPREPPDLELTLAAAEAARPDLVSLRRQVARWEAETRSQKRQALPTLGLQAGYIYQRQQPIGAPNQNEWEASVAMSLPLFDRNQGNIAKAESQARQAGASLEAARVALRAELAQALAAFRGARAGVAAADADQLAAARSLKDRMQAAYEAGGRTILEVLDAARAYRDALRLHTRVHSAYRHALYRLQAAAGVPSEKWEAE